MVKAVISAYTPVGKNALFAVKISSNDDVHERVVPLNSKNSYAAQLMAVKYVCEAIENKDIKLEIVTSMPYIANVFQKSSDGKWKKTRKGTNSDLVDEVKDLLKKFSSFSLTVDIDDEPAKLKTIAKSHSSI